MGDKVNEATRCLEAAFDKAALQGAKSGDMLQAMLNIFLATMLDHGCSPEEIASHVATVAREMQKSLRDTKVTIGPPLGEGDN